MQVYKGVLDKIDMKKIGLKTALDRTIKNTRILLEEGYQKTLNRTTKLVIHLSLIDRFERFYCINFSHPHDFGLTHDGYDYLSSKYRLFNNDKGLIWGLLGNEPPWMAYDSDNDVFFVKEFENPEVKNRTFELVSVPSGAYDIACVLFYKIKFGVYVVGTLAVDIYIEKKQDKIDIPVGIPLYTIFLQALNSIVSLTIEGLHRGYYDPIINEKEMKCIFSRVYLLR